MEESKEDLIKKAELELCWLVAQNRELYMEVYLRHYFRSDIVARMLRLQPIHPNASVFNKHVKR